MALTPGRALRLAPSGPLDREEIRSYLDTVQRIGALSHAATDEAYEEMRDAGAIDEDPVGRAEDILLIERAKELLLG
jgi:hypothetical protein